jgi:hypothetical protein
MYNGLHVKYLLFFLEFNETLISSKDYSTNTQILNFMKILPEGVELSHADRRDEGNGRFSQFCERAWKWV